MNEDRIILNGIKGYQLFILRMTSRLWWPFVSKMLGRCFEIGIINSMQLHEIADVLDVRYGAIWKVKRPLHLECQKRGIDVQALLSQSKSIIQKYTKK